jgi:hypothetical protein
MLHDRPLLASGAGDPIVSSTLGLQQQQQHYAAIESDEGGGGAEDAPRMFQQSAWLRIIGECQDSATHRHALLTRHRSAFGRLARLFCWTPHTSCGNRGTAFVWGVLVFSFFMVLAFALYDAPWAITMSIAGRDVIDLNALFSGVLVCVVTLTMVRAAREPALAALFALNTHVSKRRAARAISVWMLGAFACSIVFQCLMVIPKLHGKLAWYYAVVCYMINYYFVLALGTALFAWILVTRLLTFLVDAVALQFRTLASVLNERHQLLQQNQTTSGAITIVGGGGGGGGDDDYGDDDEKEKEQKQGGGGSNCSVQQRSSGSSSSSSAGDKLLDLEQQISFDKVEEAIQGHATVSFLIARISSVFAPLILAKTFTDFSLLIVGLSNTLHGDAAFITTILTVIVSLVVAFVLLLPAAALTGRFQNLIHSVRLLSFDSVYL